MSAEGCPDCGAAVGGQSECQELFERVGMRAYADAAYARTHRLVVDAYALQHPDRYCRSGKSLAAHLTGACVFIENPDEPELNRVVQRWLSRNPSLTRLTPPEERGRVTVADVAVARDPEEHDLRVRAWAMSAWQAWSAHHALAREWIERARRQTPVAVR